MPNIYVMVSRTETKFAKALRKFGKIKFNHASIALDSELQHLYSFARTEQYGFLPAKLVPETTDRFLVNAKNYVAVEIYALPVSEQEYLWVQGTIDKVMKDPEYHYNLFSVLTYPVLKGFSTYKSFSCIEFVMYILQYLQYLDPSCYTPLPQFRPDDLCTMLSPYRIFAGNLLDYISNYTYSDCYFQSVSLKLVRDTCVCFCVISLRSLRVFLGWSHRKVRHSYRFWRHVLSLGCIIIFLD